MRCRYCHIALAPLRSLSDGEFCCDDHRAAYETQQATAPPEPTAAAPALQSPAPELKIVAIEEHARARTPLPEPVISVRPVTVTRVRAAKAVAVVKAIQPEPPIAGELLRLPFDLAALDGAPDHAPLIPPESTPVIITPALSITLPPLPRWAIPPLEMPVEPVEVAEAPIEAEAAQAFEQPYTAESLDEGQPVADVPETVDEPAESHPAGNIAASWQWLRTTWNRAPRDLKLVTVGLPLLALIAVTSGFPNVSKNVAPPQVAEVQKAVDNQWKSIEKTISNRAAIAYADDFRSGLDAWESRSNLTSTWSYDRAGFVEPGPLALFKPTLDLADYRVEFLGEIDKKALGWVFRAEDLKNYYAMKLVVVQPGPLPVVDLVHYAVIDGKPGREIRKRLPLTVRSDSLYRIAVDVRGGDFTVMAQGHLVDFWTDNRLQHGGIGFFSGRGERARLRWVEVSHQYDALGRVCAYLSPYGLEGRNGSFN